MTLHLKAEAEDAGTRLDAFVASHANGLTRSQAARYIEEGRVSVDGEPAALTPTEYDILKLLMENPGQVFHPRDIYKRVWKDEPYGAESTVAVHIRHLRETLEINPAEPRYIKVVWGKG